MTSWIAVTAQEPPKDRVIEVTSGLSWTHEDTHFKARRERSGVRPEHTCRVWKTRGMVLLALWYETGMTHPGWFNPTTHIPIPEFRFWREYENPVEDHPDLYTSVVPPVPGMQQTFDGDARRAEHLRKAAEADDWVERFKVGPLYRPGDVMDEKAIGHKRAEAAGYREMAERAYDPPLPPKS